MQRQGQGERTSGCVIRLPPKGSATHLPEPGPGSIDSRVGSWEPRRRSSSKRPSFEGRRWSPR